MQQSKKTLWSVLVFALPVGLLLVALVTRMGGFGRTREHTPAIVANKRYSQTIAEWKGKKFVEVKSSAHLVQMLSDVPFIGQEHLSGDMRAQLMDSIGSMMAGYNDRDYAQYKRFRILSDTKAKPKSINWQRKQLVDRYGGSAEQIPRDDNLVHELFFKHAFASRLTSQCFSLFSPIDSLIEIESCQTTPKSFSQFFDDRKNAGLLQYIGTYQSDFPRDDEISSSRPLLIATCMFLVKIQLFNDPCPFACRFYWDTTVKKWRPVNLGIAYVGPCPVDFVF